MKREPSGHQLDLRVRVYENSHSPTFVCIQYLFYILFFQLDFCICSKFYSLEIVLIIKGNFWFVDFQDIADPFFAYCKMHADKTTARAKRRNWLAIQSHVKMHSEKEIEDEKEKVPTSPLTKIVIILHILHIFIMSYEVLPKSLEN